MEPSDAGNGEIGGSAEEQDNFKRKMEKSGRSLETEGSIHMD